MTEHRTASEGIKGFVEDMKGRAKEAIGALGGNDSLQREGQAQQDKAQAQQDVAQQEAEAEEARRRASAEEQRQREEQDPR